MDLRSRTDSRPQRARQFYYDDGSKDWIHMSFPKFMRFWSAFYETQGDFYNSYWLGKYSAETIVKRFMKKWNEERHKEFITASETGKDKPRLK